MTTLDRNRIAEAIISIAHYLGGSDLGLTDYRTLSLSVSDQENEKEDVYNIIIDNNIMPDKPSFWLTSSFWHEYLSLLESKIGGSTQFTEELKNKLGLN